MSIFLKICIVPRRSGRRPAHRLPAAAALDAGPTPAGRPFLRAPLRDRGEQGGARLRVQPAGRRVPHRRPGKVNTYDLDLTLISLLDLLNLSA